MSESCFIPGNHGHIGVMWKTVSEACNLACDYCYYSTCGGQPKTINRIESEILEKFIREYMEISKGGVSFAWQGGEPLLAGLDFFEEVVRLQAKYAPKNTIISNALQTNATLIDEEWASFFKKYNFLIGVSLDGPKEINDQRRVTGHGMGSYDRVMRGINHLRAHQVDFNILTVVHEDNVGKAKELMPFYEQEGFSHIQFIPCMDFRSQDPSQPGHYVITPEQYGQFLCDVFDVWYNDGNPTTSIRFFDNMLNVYLHTEAQACIHRQSCPITLIFEQNGDAFPCDFYINDSYKLGNIGVNSLTEILSSPNLKQFLNMKPTLADKCKSCKYLNLCYGGCPRNRKWNDDHSQSSPDYFCRSYMRFYEYAHERMENVACNVKKRWLKEHVEAGLKIPKRNERCICGSGKKFKQCCASLLNSTK